MEGPGRRRLFYLVSHLCVLYFFYFFYFFTFSATAFVSLSHEMKDCYALYCRNYDDAQILKEKVNFYSRGVGYLFINVLNYTINFC